VLIMGETGTGKELVARAIHGSGPRKDRPLVKDQLCNFANHLIENELFGHERGRRLPEPIREIQGALK